MVDHNILGVWSGASSDKGKSGRRARSRRQGREPRESGGGAQRRALTPASTRGTCRSDDAPATTTSCGRHESRIRRFLAVANIEAHASDLNPVAVLINKAVEAGHGPERAGRPRPGGPRRGLEPAAAAAGVGPTGSGHYYHPAAELDPERFNGAEKLLVMGVRRRGGTQRPGDHEYPSCDRAVPDRGDAAAGRGGRARKRSARRRSSSAICLVRSLSGGHHRNPLGASPSSESSASPLD